MYKGRVFLIVFFVVGLWGAMVTRGAYLQLIPNPQFEKIKSRQFSRLIKLSPRRGDILDREGRELAVSITGYSLFADPAIIDDPYGTAKKLSRHFRTSFRFMYDKIKDKKRRFVWIKRRLERQDFEAIEKWGIRGLGFKEEFKRVYPGRTLASDVLGFVGREQQGLSGLEKQFEEILSGAGTQLRVQRDARGRPLIEDGRVFASVPEGSDVYLTIDKELQFWVESQLKKSVEDNKADSAWAVVLNPENSEILALASYPSFDSNKPLGIASDLRRNKAIHDVYEAGSVMKAISVGGALEKQIVAPNTRINTENGEFKIGKRVIREADKNHYFKELTVSEIMAYSSNVGTSKIALSMTDEVLYQTLLDFGFGEKLGVGLPGEAKGLLSPPPWRDHLTANISFGHGVAVTALQVANAYAAIANGGVLHRPYIVKEIRDVAQGEIIKTPKKVIRRVLSEKNAGLLKMMLSSVVAEGGSGYRARIDGFPVAGKTGTAQKVNPDGRGYLPGQYISNFAGFIPANNPKYVIYVAVDSPRAQGYYASTVAAPIFRNIAQYALRRDRTTPVYVTDQDQILQQQMQAEESAQVAKTKKLAEIPELRRSMAIMPNLQGMTLREVLRELQGEPLSVSVQGKGVVKNTWPAPGEKVGDKVKIKLSQ